MFKTPKHILQKIERCREKQEKRLDLKKSNLLEIPPEVFTLTHLEEIDLRKNAIQIVSLEIKQLKSLKFIDLRYNPLRQVADVFGLFVHYVDFQNLHLSPANIIGLKFTLFSYDPPVKFEDFPNLTALDISHHRFKTLPHWVLSLTHLTFLDLSWNKIENFKEIQIFGNLSSLDLS